MAYIFLSAHTNQKTNNVDNGFPDYLCKWQGLSHADCTWEDGELISDKFKKYVDEYHTRNKSQKIPSKQSKVNFNILTAFNICLTI